MPWSAAYPATSCSVQVASGLILTMPQLSSKATIGAGLPGPGVDPLEAGHPGVLAGQRLLEGADLAELAALGACRTATARPRPPAWSPSG